jgi:hypothetical protein
MSRLLALLFVACGSGAAPAPAVAPPPVSPAASFPDAGPAVVGPCDSAHDCVLRDHCGCTCEAELLGKQQAIKCEETCSPNNTCAGYSLICDLNQHICGAIPPAPGLPHGTPPPAH